MSNPHAVYPYTRGRERPAPSRPGVTRQQPALERLIHDEAPCTPGESDHAQAGTTMSAGRASQAMATIARPATVAVM
jgi:hypothetical protein